VLRLPEEYVYTAFDTRVDHLLIGCALAVLRERGQLDQAMKIFASRLALMLPTLGLIVLSQLGTHAFGAQFRNAVGFYVEPLLMALLIIQLLASGEHWAVRWLDSAPMRFLGTVSYPLYLYHGIGGAMVARLLQQRLGVPFLPALFLGFPASVAVASVSYFVVEKPFLRLKERLAK
jgi:peptidoglycan/LPS O-acetylase OafA/YrhL